MWSKVRAEPGEERERDDGLERDSSIPFATPFHQASPARRMRRAIPTFLLAAAFAGIVGTAVNRISGGALWAFTKQADNFNQREKDKISQDFYAHGPIKLERVKFGDLGKAISSMKLSPDEEKDFRAELALATEMMSASDGARMAGKIRAAAPAPAALPAPADRDDEFRLPMAWITVWDYRDEDGDVVRIVSSGYSRTVPIVNQQVTLALPMPTGGVVNVIGVHDGHGGITLGVSSGAMPVSLPVMTEGQIIGVPVIAQ
jgi:hypothetical protein